MKHNSIKNDLKKGMKSLNLRKIKQNNKQLQDKVDNLDDKYLRAEAEVQNTHKRAAKNQQETEKYRSASLAKSVLPCLDDMKRAMNTKITDKDSVRQLKQGIKMVYDHLTGALADNEITEINVKKHDSFNPEVAQAVQTTPATKDCPAGTIAAILQKGYRIHDRILRPAVVVVAEKMKVPSDENKSSSSDSSND